MRSGDVQVGVGRKAVRDEIDERFESSPFPSRRNSATLNRPVPVKCRLVGSIRPARFDDSKQVFDSIDFIRAEERVALHVEEQVAW